MSWEKEDKKVWKNSAVMREFEKQIVAIMSKINELNKEAASPEDQAATQNMSAAEKGAYYGAKEKAMSSMSQDHMLEDKEEGSEEDALEKEAQKIISDLNIILKKAKENSDMSAVYNIERAIQEIKDR